MKLIFKEKNELDKNYLSHQIADLDYCGQNG